MDPGHADPRSTVNTEMPDSIVIPDDAEIRSTRLGSGRLMRKGIAVMQRWCRVRKPRRPI